MLDRIPSWAPVHLQSTRESALCPAGRDKSLPPVPPPHVFPLDRTLFSRIVVSGATRHATPYLVWGAAPTHSLARSLRSLLSSWASEWLDGYFFSFLFIFWTIVPWRTFGFGAVLRPTTMIFFLSLSSSFLIPSGPLFPSPPLPPLPIIPFPFPLPLSCSSVRWGVSNIKCCFDCYVGSCLYGNLNSKNIVVVQIWNFHQEPLAFWKKPFLFWTKGRFVNLREGQTEKRQKNFFPSQCCPFTITIAAGHWLRLYVAAKTKHYRGNQTCKSQNVRKKVRLSKYVSVKRSWRK